MWFINNRRRTLIPTTYDIDFPLCFSFVVFFFLTAFVVQTLSFLSVISMVCKRATATSLSSIILVDLNLSLYVGKQGGEFQ